MLADDTSLNFTIHGKIAHWSGDLSWKSRPLTNQPLLEIYQQLLTSISDHPNTPLAQLPLLNSQTIAQLHLWNIRNFKL